MKTALWTAWAALLVWASAADAGEGYVTKVRGRTLTIDKGAEDGLEVGIEVTLVRPPGESIIHPITGENLGSPEIEVATGRITKVSARAASVQLDATHLIAVRPGDLARFLTFEEKMVMEQETATEESEKAAKERAEIRSESSRLAKSISGIQGTIKGLESAIRDLRRFDDDVVKPQFNSINRQMAEMRQELVQLRETVSLMASVPVHDITEDTTAAAAEPSPEELERLRALIQEELDKLTAQMQAVAPPPPPVDTLPPPPDLTLEEEDTGLLDSLAAQRSLLEQPMLWAGVGGVGLLGLAFWLYTRLSAGTEEDEEEEEDEEVGGEEEEAEEEAEVDVEEEEDDIVVEETS